MKISHASHHRWFRQNSPNPLEFLTGRNGKKISQTIPLLETCGVYYKISELKESFFELFVPLYEQSIGSKQNAIVHNVKEKTFGSEKKPFTYYSLSVFENEEFVGGTIFSLRPNRIVYAYRVFENSWKNAKLKAGPALVGEYAIAKFGSERDLEFISHGRDRNPYGLNSAIGLATFKLSVGCYPLLTETYDVQELDTETLTTDTLVLLMPTEQRRITKAKLFTTEANLEKHIQVTKYPELLDVEIILRD